MHAVQPAYNCEKPERNADLSFVMIRTHSMSIAATRVALIARTAIASDDLHKSPDVLQGTFLALRNTIIFIFAVVLNFGRA